MSATFLMYNPNLLDANKFGNMNSLKNCDQKKSLRDPKFTFFQLFAELNEKSFHFY